MGYSFLLKKKKIILMQPNRVTLANGLTKNYQRIFVPKGVPLKSVAYESLRVNILFKHIQARPQRI